MYGNAVQCIVIIGKFRHKGLKRLYEDDDPRGVPAHSVRKIKAVLAVLEFADNLSQVATMPGWKLHPLRGDRKSEYGITLRATGELLSGFRATPSPM